MIELVWPWLLLLLPLPFLARMYLKPQDAEQAPLMVPELNAFSFDDTKMQAERGPRWPLVLLILCWVALVIAATRPQWTGDPVSLPTSGRDLMLAIDISGSMSVEDMQLGNQNVDRLTVVKAVISDFVDRRQGDRVGLILFGSNAYLQAPLTFDLASVETLLTEAPVGIAGGKTAIGEQQNWQMLPRFVSIPSASAQMNSRSPGYLAYSASVWLTPAPILMRRHYKPSPTTPAVDTSVPATLRNLPKFTH